VLLAGRRWLWQEMSTARGSNGHSCSIRIDLDLARAGRYMKADPVNAPWSGEDGLPAGPGLSGRRIGEIKWSDELRADVGSACTVEGRKALGNQALHIQTRGSYGVRDRARSTLAEAS
jgi:hypothetical protein